MKKKKRGRGKDQKIRERADRHIISLDHAEPCANLFRAVINQAIRDAKITIKRHTPTHIVIDQEDAENWFSGRSRDFDMVCDLADIYPTCVLAIAYKEINRINI